VQQRHTPSLISAESNRFKRDQQQRTGFGGSDYGLSIRVTEAKRIELAALRRLAKACAKVRTNQDWR
jgi:hypothetical protein